MMAVDFQSLAGGAAAEAGLAGRSAEVGKEILHYDILHVMCREGLLERMVFHGGTALRLCHGGVRLSEDLDFCASPGLSDVQAAGLGPMLKQYLEERYGHEVRASSPKKRDLETVNIQRWWVRMAPDATGRTHGSKPWFRIKLEIADVQEQKFIRSGLVRNYSIIPASHTETQLRVATMAGILADKLVAFPVSLPVYVRWRDVWDIQWMLSRDVRMDASLVQTRLDGYGIKDFNERLTDAVRQVPDLLGSGEMATTLDETVPPELAAKTLHNSEWLEGVAAKFQILLTELQEALAVSSQQADELDDQG